METPASHLIRQHAQLFDVPGHAVIATTLEGTIVYWSDYATRLFGWTPDEVLGKSITTVTPVDENLAIEIMARLRDGDPWSGNFRLKNRDGKEFEARVSDIPVRDREGEIIGIVGVTRPPGS